MAVFTRPLSIIIIGAGIGGLSAALALRRNGHFVTIYEQSHFAVELGPAVILAPNATGLLRRWAIYPETDGAVQRQWYMDTGQLLSSTDLSKTSHLWPHPGLLCHRISIHKLLRQAVISSDGLGPPAKLFLGSRVVEINVNTATIYLENGTQSRGDLVIGADGVKSITRTKVFEAKPFPSGKSAYRFLVERKKALNHPLVADLEMRDGEFSIWYGTDRRIWIYTTQRNELLNFVCMHPDELSTTPASEAAFGEDTTNVSHKSNMMEIFKDFDPRVLALMDGAEPSSIRLWQLLDTDPIPTRVAGKLCLLGDAALAFLPHIGQGAACAIEDAASLAAALVPGTALEDIPERLQLYDRCRRDRPCVIHNQSRLLGKDLEPGNEDAKINRGRMAREFFPYIFGHDEHEYTTQKLHELLRSKF